MGADLNKQDMTGSSDVPDLLDAPVRFGTSSWAYEGWQGLIYHRPYAKSRFSRECLSEYAAFRHEDRPLFDTVGIDHTFGNFGHDSFSLRVRYFALHVNRFPPI